MITVSQLYKNINQISLILSVSPIKWKSRGSKNNMVLLYDGLIKRLNRNNIYNNINQIINDMSFNIKTIIKTNFIKPVIKQIKHTIKKPIIKPLLKPLIKSNFIKPSKQFNFLKSQNFLIKKDLAFHFHNMMVDKEYNLESLEVNNINGLYFLIKNFDEFIKTLPKDKQSSMTHKNKYGNSYKDVKYKSLLKHFDMSAREYGINKIYYERKKERLMNINGLGFQNMNREIRNFLTYGYYNDYDLNCCHFNILKYYCINLNIETPYLNEYLNDYKTHRKELSLLNPYKTIKFIKSKINSFLYLNSPSFSNIKRKLKLTDLFKNLGIEIINIILPKLKESEMMKIINIDLDKENYYLDKRKASTYAKQKACLSFLYQNLEYKILMESLQYMKKNKLIDMKTLKDGTIKINSFVSLIHDGFMITKDIKLNVGDLNKYLYEVFNYKFIFENKPIIKSPLHQEHLLLLERSELTKEEILNTNINDLKSIGDMKLKLVNTIMSKKIKYFEYKNVEYSKYKIPVLKDDDKIFNFDNIDNTTHKQMNIIYSKIKQRHYIDYQDDIINYDTFFIKSGLGDGKTHNFIEDIKLSILNNPDIKILIVLPRIILCSELHNELKKRDIQFIKYDERDKVKGTINSEKHNLLICCINSLYRVEGHFNKVIIDECETVIKSLFSPLIKRSRRQIYNNFTNYLINADQLFLVDGLLNRKTINFILDFRKDKRNIILENKKVLTNRNDYIKYNENELLNKFKLLNLRDGKLRVFASNSKNYLVESIYKILVELDLIDEKDILIITSTENTNGKLKNLQDQLDKKTSGLILFSPTMESGNSIINPVEDFFAYYINNSSDADSSYQQTGRCRDLTNNTINYCVNNTISKNRRIRSIKRKDIKTDFYFVKDKLNDFMAKMTPYDNNISSCLELLRYDNIKSEFINKDELNLFINHIIIKNKSYRYFDYQFINNVISSGHNFKVYYNENNNISEKLEIIKSKLLHNQTKKLIREKEEELNKDVMNEKINNLDNNIKLFDQKYKNDTSDKVEYIKFIYDQPLNMKEKLELGKNSEIEDLKGVSDEYKDQIEKIQKDIINVKLYEKVKNIIIKTTKKKEDNITMKHINNMIKKIKKFETIEKCYLDKRNTDYMSEFIKTRIMRCNYKITEGKLHNKECENIKVNLEHTRKEYNYISKKRGMDTTETNTYLYYVRSQYIFKIFELMDIKTDSLESLNNSHINLNLSNVMKINNFIDLNKKMFNIAFDKKNFPHLQLENKYLYRTFNQLFLNPIGLNKYDTQKREDNSRIRKHFISC